MRQETGQRTCEICGKVMKARGIGSHIRQIHGLVITKVIHNSTKVSNDSTIVNNDSTKVSNDSTKVSNDSTIVKRPSDYVKKRSEVLETRVGPAVKGFDNLERMTCNICGKEYIPDKAGARDHDICWTCYFNLGEKGKIKR